MIAFAFIFLLIKTILSTMIFVSIFDNVMRWQIVSMT